MNNLILNRYEIISPLGAGGFGETFLAHDSQMPSRRLVVVKRLKPHQQNNSTSSDLIEKLFRKEAETLEELGTNCTQIPQLYSYFAEEGEFYLVQEYIQGKNLALIGQLSSKKVKIILGSLLNTLQYTHSKNIIHRDIKPENIILRDSDGLPVLIDFGAVKETMGAVTLGTGSTVSSVIVGTRGFMAPEQSAGRAVLSTDLYALGLTMIYALTGKLPIEFSTSPITGELEWHSHAINLDPKLAQVLDKCIKMDVGGRYPTAQATYDDLQGLDVSVGGIHPSKEKTLVIAPKQDVNSQNAPVGLPVTEVVHNQSSSSQSTKSSRFNLALIVVTVVLTVLGGFLSLNRF